MKNASLPSQEDQRPGQAKFSTDAPKLPVTPRLVDGKFLLCPIRQDAIPVCWGETCTAFRQTTPTHGVCKLIEREAA